MCTCPVFATDTTDHFQGPLATGICEDVAKSNLQGLFLGRRAVISVLRRKHAVISKFLRAPGAGRKVSIADTIRHRPHIIEIRPRRRLQFRLIGKPRLPHRLQQTSGKLMMSIRRTSIPRLTSLLLTGVR